MNNYKRLLFFFCLITLQYFALAQKRTIDSLQQILQQQKLSNQQQFEISLSLCDLYNENDPKTGTAWIVQTLQLAKKINQPTDIAKSLIALALNDEKRGRFSDGIENLQEAKKYLQNNKEKESLNFQIQLIQGSILRRESKYEESLESFLKANKIAEDLKDDTLQYAALTQLGILNVTMGNLDRAKEYHNQAISIAEKLHNYRKLAKSYGNIGIILREQEKHNEGIEYAKKALNYANLSGDSSSISYALNELGTMYDRAKKSSEATPYILQAIAIRERNNELNELAYSYIYLSGNLKRLGKINESENAVRKAFQIAQNTKNIKQIVDCYKMMYINFNESKKYDSAYIYLKKYATLKDSLAGADVKEKMEELNIKYETQKKDLKLKSERLKNIYLMTGLIFSILIIGLLYSAYLRRKLKFKNQLQELMIDEQNKSTKAIIEAEENERQRIATDLHDGVGQFMTAAKMNLQSLEDKIDFNSENDKFTFEKAIHLITDSAKEVRSISHNMAPNALLKSGLTNAVRSFIESLNQQKLKVQLFTDGIQEPIEKNTEIFLYRIIQECVNNVMKHAYASELNISIFISKHEIDITIEDNGKGFDMKHIVENSGIGMENIQKRIQYLKGEIHWDSTPGRGTTVVINVPNF